MFWSFSPLFLALCELSDLEQVRCFLSNRTRMFQLSTLRLTTLRLFGSHQWHDRHLSIVKLELRDEPGVFKDYPHIATEHWLHKKALAQTERFTSKTVVFGGTKQSCLVSSVSSSCVRTRSARWALNFTVYLIDENCTVIVSASTSIGLGSLTCLKNVVRKAFNNAHLPSLSWSFAASRFVWR